MVRATSTADFTETSCSSEQPPNRITIVSVDMGAVPLVVPALGEGRLDRLVQRPAGAVGDVGGDDDVREASEPPPEQVVDRRRGPGGGAVALLALEHVQRGAAQTAVGECREQR